MNKSCLNCRHYYATYNPNTPRGCRVYGFETASFPSFVVKRESGEDCKAYQPSKRAQDAMDSEKAKKKMDLNDPKLWG